MKHGNENFIFKASNYDHFILFYNQTVIEAEFFYRQYPKSTYFRMVCRKNKISKIRNEIDLNFLYILKPRSVNFISI